MIESYNFPLQKAIFLSISWRYQINDGRNIRQLEKKALKYLKSYLKNKDIVRFYLYVVHEQAC